MSYSNFNTFKLFQNVGINSSSDYMLSMKPNDNNVSFHSSNSIDYNNVDIMSIKNIINKKQNEDLNLSSLTGTTINPVITINNNHSDCRIKTNLNVSGNLNVLNEEGIFLKTNNDNYTGINWKNSINGALEHYIQVGMQTIPYTNNPDFTTKNMIFKSHNGFHFKGVTNVVTGGLAWAYINLSNVWSLSSGPNTSQAITAKFDGAIYVDNYIVMSSDSRIKTNITDVPDNLALQQLRTIPCRYYEYIDKLKRGNDKTIGFIAQEVKSVLPIAVSQQVKIIPNVYKVINCIWTSVDDKFSMSSSDLTNVNGVKYKFYVTNESDGSDEKEIEITGNSNNTFTFDAQYTSVFCYGSEVNDFHTIDKNKLFTLNFSASQEIDRIQQTHITEIASLKAEVSTLKTENQQQQNEINTLKTENVELKSIIDKLKTASSFEEFKQTL
jgi:FtsZ-binding cell division protein ZapB